MRPRPDAERFVVEQLATTEREPFGEYAYRILRGGRVVASYWHDYRGDAHRLELATGEREESPVGRMIDFLAGGGPEPLTLSKAAVDHLVARLAPGGRGGRRSRLPPRMMKKTVAAASPDAYIAALDGWRKKLVESLRRAIRAAGEPRGLDEGIKWRNLVYFSNGAVLLVRAEEERVLLGFFRGKRLREVEPRLVASGKYELANIVFREGDAIAPKRVKELVAAAIELNAELGDPTTIRST